MENDYPIEIQKEYKKIEEKWLNLHYRTFIGIVIFSLFLECLMGIFMCNSDELHTSIPNFIFKFLIIPGSINLLCVLIDYKVMHSKTISQTIKRYIISLLFVFVCFVLFTVHIIFSSLYFTFVVAILLTTIYADYKLTTITAFVSIVSEIISELFIQWDIDKLSIYSNSTRAADFIIANFLLVGFSAVCMVVIYFEKEKNAASIQKELERYALEERLKTDALTGIFNRTALRKEITEIDEDIAENSYFFAMIDIDDFKMINDQYGHPVGDHCLVEVGRILNSNCVNATPFRFGGDEFCILFKNHTILSVFQTCQKIQQDMKECRFIKNENITITASIGIVAYEKNMLSANLIVNTDRALYEAKTVKNAIRIFNH